MHDCFTIELTGECLKCLFRLTGGVPAVVVQSEALWARIPEIQVRIPSRAMGTFFPHTVSSIFRLSLTPNNRLWSPLAYGLGGNNLLILWHNSPVEVCYFPSDLLTLYNTRQ